MIVKSSRCHFEAIFGFLEPNPAALYTKLRSASINPHQFRCGKRAVSTMVNALHANRMSQKSPTVRSAARMENTWSASVCRLDKPTRTRFCLNRQAGPDLGIPSGSSANLTLPDYVRVARHTGTTSTATKGSDLPSADILSSVQSSRRFADHFHRETTNTVIVLPHWEKLDNLRFKLL